MQTEEGLSFTITLSNQEFLQALQQSQSGLNDLGDTASSQASKASQAFRQFSQDVEQNGSSLKQTLADIGKNMAGYVGGQLTLDAGREFINQVINVRAELEALRASLVSMAGENLGNKIFSQLKQLGSTTPISIDAYAKASQTLISFGLDAEKVVPMLKTIGDISLGDANKFQSLSLAFAQMSATGKLMGQDLNQMVNAGFSPLEYIARKTGKTIGELKGNLGAIDAEMVTEAFKTATQEGERFFEGMASQSKGLKGLLAQLEAAFQDMYNGIGGDSEGVIGSVIEGTTLVVKNYREIAEVIGVVIATYGVYRAALLALTATEGIRKAWLIAQIALEMQGTTATTAKTAALIIQDGATKALTASTSALNAVWASNPLGVAVAVVGALAYGIYKLATYQSDAEKSQEAFNKAVADANASIEAERQGIEELMRPLKEAKAGTDEWRTAKEKLMSKHGDLIKQLGIEITETSNLVEVQNKLTQAILETAKARARDQVLEQAQGDYSKEHQEYADIILEKMKGYYKDDNKAREATRKLIALADKPNNIGLDKTDPELYRAMIATKAGLQVSGISIAKGRLKERTEDLNAIYGAPKDEDKQTKLQDLTLDKLLAKRRQIYESDKQDLSLQRQLNQEVQRRVDGANSISAIDLQLEALKNQQKELTIGSELYKKTQAEIEALEAKKPKKAHKANASSSNQAQKLQDEAYEAQQEYDRRRQREAQEAELELRSNRISLMQEGTERELAEINLGYDRLILATEKREQEMVDKLRDLREKEYKAQNPKSKKAFDRYTITAQDLSPQEQHQLQASRDFAGEQRLHQTQQIGQKIINETKDYEAKLNDLHAEYQQKRSLLFQSDGKTLIQGATEGNLRELDHQFKDKENAIVEAQASRFESYKAFVAGIGELTIQQLRESLQRAKEELDQYEQRGELDKDTAAVARAKVQKLTETLSTKEATTAQRASSAGRSLKDWEALGSIIERNGREFDKLGDKIGGSAGKALKGIGSMVASASSMINNITQVVSTITTGFQTTASGAQKAMSTLELATGIIGIITTAISIFQSVASLFGGDEEEKRLQRLKQTQEEVERMQSDIENRHLARLRAIKLAYDDIGNSIRSFHAKGDHFWYDVDASKIEQTYRRLKYTAIEELGKSPFAQMSEDVKNYSEQIAKLDKSRQEDTYKKKTAAWGIINLGYTRDWDKYNELTKQIEEKTLKLLETIRGATEQLMGGSVGEIANQLGGAFLEAFRTGEDAAEAFGQKAEEIGRKVLQDILTQKLLYEPIGKIFDKYQAQIAEAGADHSLEAMAALVPKIAKDYKALIPAVKSTFEAFPDEVKNMLKGTEEATRKASERGIQSISQDTAVEMNGRLTAIQSHTYQIAQSHALLQTYTTNALSLLSSIEGSSLRTAQSTSTIRDEILSIRGEMTAVRSALQTITDKGVKAL